MSNATESSTNQNGKNKDQSENPYEILDQYLEAAYKTARADSNPVQLTPEQEIKKLKVIISNFYVSLLTYTQSYNFVHKRLFLVFFSKFSGLKIFD